MDNLLATTVIVVTVGMVLLFVALLLLYAMMYLMTTFIKDGSEVETVEQAPEVDERALRLHAAAIAVALARAETELSPAGSPEEDGKLHPWKQYHRHRVLNLRSRVRTTR